MRRAAGGLPVVAAAASSEAMSSSLQNMAGVVAGLQEERCSTLILIRV